MSDQMIFNRYELKYLLTQQQKALVLEQMKPYMALDRYGRTTIRNLYYDTDNFRLIRRSIERPAYKEKLRVRSYGPAHGADTVFVELKKKYKSVVYKRRISLPDRQAADWLGGLVPLPLQTQIAQEIEYVRTYYQMLRPMVFLSYEREAFYSLCKDDFRVTFDENILARTHTLSLASEPSGASLLQPGRVLMEIKTSGGIPLWMSHFLTQQHLYKTSYSKYGTAYQTMIYPTYEGGYLYA